MKLHPLPRATRIRRQRTTAQTWYIARRRDPNWALSGDLINLEIIGSKGSCLCILALTPDDARQIGYALIEEANHARTLEENR